MYGILVTLLFVPFYKSLTILPSPIKCCLFVMIIRSRCSIVLGGGGEAIRLTLQGQKKMKMKYKGKEKVKVSKTLSLIVGMNMSDT